MRLFCLTLIAICVSADAAERRPTLLTRLSQIAPDGFPLRFPERSAPAAAPAPAPAPLPQPEELPAPGPRLIPATPIPVPSPVPVVPVRYMTHREFAATFHPVPGNYEVMMIHPYTHRPVKVCFSLPPGHIKEVDADRSELRFDYGKWELEVHFKRDGRVVLDIDD